MNMFNTQEIEGVVSAARGGHIPPELSGVLYSLGRDAENEEEYEYAFHMLTSLSGHPSNAVVSMVILAYSLLAVYHKRLDRSIIEPIIKKTWPVSEGLNKARIEDAVDDINNALKWNLTLEKIQGT